MPKLRHVDVMFSAKLAAFSFGVLGGMMGLIYSLGGFLFDLFTDALGFGTVLAFLALVIMPSLLAAAGFVVGALVALIYNSSAKLGLTIEDSL